MFFVIIPVTARAFTIFSSPPLQFTVDTLAGPPLDAGKHVHPYAIGGHFENASSPAGTLRKRNFRREISGDSASFEFLTYSSPYRFFALRAAAKRIAHAQNAMRDTPCVRCQSQHGAVRVLD